MKFRMLQAHYIGDRYYEAGEVADLPGWIPTPNVDPLDEAAVLAVYRAGPSSSRDACGIGGERSMIDVALNVLGHRPITHWKSEPIHPSLFHKRWRLTGLGAHLPPINEC